MAEQQLSLQEFASKLRERYPDLADVPDVTLVGKALAAAPDLKQFVDIGNLPGMNAIQKVSADSRTGGLNPFTSEVMQDQAANVIKGIPQAITSIPGVVQTLAKGMTGNPKETVQNLRDMILGAAQPAVTSARGALSGRKISLPGLTGGVQIPELPEGDPSNPAWAQAAQGAGAQLAAAELPNALEGMASLVPSKVRAGANLGKVAAVVGENPTKNMTAADAVASRYSELTERGHPTTKVFEDYLKRQEHPLRGPMTYNESFDFASKAGQLSAEEKLAANPQMQAQVSKFAKALKEANRATAEEAGMGKVYDQAMTEYRRASNIADKAAVVKKWALYGALTGAAGGAGYRIIRDLMNRP